MTLTVSNQNKMIRFLLGKGPRAHVGSNELQRVSWLDVQIRVNQIKLNSMHKIVHLRSPQYLIEKFEKHANRSRYYTRNSDMMFKLPRYQTNTGQSTFTWTGIKQWNDLPTHIRKIENHSLFKTTVQQYLINKMSLKR